MAELHRYLDPDLENHEFTLDDAILSHKEIPGFFPSEVDPSVQLTKRTMLKTGIIGSPMDTVTESAMAVLLAKMGGIGVIHAAMPVDRQVEEVRRVRRWKAGFVTDPKVLGPDATLLDLLRVEEEWGFSSYPVTKNSTLGTPVVGIVTDRDIRGYRDDPRYHDMKISQIMTPREKLIYAERENTLDKNDIRAANALIRQHGLDTLPILDKEGKVSALVTWSDLKKHGLYPNATVDDNKQLKVLAAVEPRLSLAQERIEALAKSGASGIVVDSRNIYEDFFAISKFAKAFADWDVIGGNIVHPSVLKEVLERGSGFVDAFRCGIGTGEVCITSEDLGIGRAMGSTLRDLDAAYKEMGGDNKYGHIGFMADGGIKFAKHFLIAAALHKNFGGVMMGSVLGGFDESPGDKIQVAPGVYKKMIRGMGSAPAQKERLGAGAARYGVDQSQRRHAEGIVKEVPAIGAGQEWIEDFYAGIITGMQSLGARNIPDLYDRANISKAVSSASKGTL